MSQTLTNQIPGMGGMVAQPASPPDVLALQLVVQTGAVPYLDPAGEPRIRRASDGAEHLPWPIRSRETEAWVAKLHFENSQKLLSRGQIDRVLLYLEGKAEENQQNDMELCDAIDSEPMLGLLIRIIKHEQYLKTTAENLLNRLNELAKGSPYLLGSRRWPKSPEALGRRVRGLQTWLNKAEITINHEREGRHRWIILTDGHDRQRANPSPELSQLNSATDNDFRRRDGNDGVNNTNPEAEFARIMKGETI